MKKSTAYVFLYFAIIIAIACMTSCTASKGYDYNHHAKHRNTGPSKCFKKHNNW